MTIASKITQTFLQENKEDLNLWGEIRFVLMWSADLVAVINNLHLHEKLEFPSVVFAATLDELHRKLFEGDIPQEGDRWMEKFVVTTLLKGIKRLSRSADMFPAPRAVEQ